VQQVKSEFESEYGSSYDDQSDSSS